MPTEKSNIARSAFTMSVATFISRIVGFVREMIVASFLGASGLSDSFFVAFRIPNLLRELFAEGSMSSGLIPVLSEYRTTKGEEETRRLVGVTLSFILVFIGLACLVGLILASPIVRAIAPGFLSDPVKFRTTVTLTRVMFPFLLFVSLSALAMGALNAKKVFFVPAMASTWFNVAVITTILALSRIVNNTVLVVAIGVTFGGCFQFFSQVGAFRKNGYSLMPVFDFGHPGLKKIGLLILPAMAGTAVAQVNIFISTILASYLPAGSITYLFYAMRLVQFPVGVFGVAMGMAVIPSLSEHAAKKDFDSLSRDFSFSLKLLFAITLPSMVGLMALAEPIISTLFQRGRFDYEAVRGTMYAHLCYCLGIWAMVGVRVVASTFYSLQDTKTPVKMAVVAVTINVLLSAILMVRLAHAGLALATSISSMVNFLGLFYFLRKKLRKVSFRDVAGSFFRTLLASAAMGGAGWYLGSLRSWNTAGHTLIKFLYLFSTMGLCVGIYLLVSVALKSEEVHYMINTAKRKFRGRK
ncbi:MAG: murein biosynthesis integral membrane protein MurJ [Nitrospirae bacterium]|nr:murein biosynthesis integral membrane protein MurJ [Nitrospirota bacterium]